MRAILDRDRDLLWLPRAERTSRLLHSAASSLSARRFALPSRALGPPPSRGVRAGRRGRRGSTPQMQPLRQSEAAALATEPGQSRRSRPTRLALRLRLRRPAARGGATRFRDDRAADLLVHARPMPAAVHETPSAVAIARLTLRPRLPRPQHAGSALLHRHLRRSPHTPAAPVPRALRSGFASAAPQPAGVALLQSRDMRLWAAVAFVLRALAAGPVMEPLRR